MSINQAVIVGHLGKDPEGRETSSGVGVTVLSVATNQMIRNATTKALDPHVEWHRVVLFEKQAKAAQQHLKKGAQVAVIGRLKTTKYEDNQGITRQVTEVIAEKISFLSRADNQQASFSENPAEAWDI